MDGWIIIITNVKRGREKQILFNPTHSPSVLPWYIISTVYADTQTFPVLRFSGQRSQMLFLGSAQATSPTWRLQLSVHRSLLSSLLPSHSTFFSSFSFSPWYFLTFLCSFFLMLSSLGMATLNTTVVLWYLSTTRLIGPNQFVSLDQEVQQDLCPQICSCAAMNSASVLSFSPAFSSLCYVFPMSATSSIWRWHIPCRGLSVHDDPTVPPPCWVSDAWGIHQAGHLWGSSVGSICTVNPDFDSRLS